MKILYVVASYYPHIGGVEYVVKSIAERLASKGHDVIVLAGEPNAEKTVEEEIDRVHVIRWPTWSPGNAYHVPKAASKFVERVAELCSNADILHAHSIHSVIAYYAWRGWKKCGGRAKFVITPHYHGTGHTAIRRLLWIPWRLAIGKVLSNADVVHSVSQYEAEMLKRDFGVEPVVIGHGVDEDVSKYRWEPGGYAMYAGRIEKYKNVELAARIIAEMNKRYGTDLELMVVGEGTYKEKLRRSLDRMGIRYEMLPFQPRERYLKLLSHAELFIMPSKREAFSITALEAIAIGVPTVVASPWGRHFEGYRRALVIDINTHIEELSRKVYEFMRAQGRHDVDDILSWNRIIDKYLSHIYRGCYSE